MSRALPLSLQVRRGRVLGVADCLNNDGCCGSGVDFGLADVQFAYE